MYGTGVVPLLPPEVRRGRLMIWRQIDLVIDVGANSGQYGGALRAAGYGGRILSFEPLAEAFATLSERCLDDPLWDCHCIAVGAGAGSAVLNVSRDLEASSILPMEERHVRHWPPSAYVGAEPVKVERLDALVPPLRGRGVYLKIDVQGYELEVLAGARESMPDITLIEAELSLVPLYSGGPLYLEVVERLRGHGFELISVEGITEEPESGHMLQLDGVFGRPSAADGDR